MRLLWLSLPFLGIANAFAPSLTRSLQVRRSANDFSTSLFLAKNASEVSHEEIEKYRDGMSVIPRSNGSSEVSRLRFLYCWNHV